MTGFISPEEWFYKNRGERATWAETAINWHKFRDILAWMEQYHKAATDHEQARLRQALVDCHLACADAVRELDADAELESDSTTGSGSSFPGQGNDITP